MIAAKPAFTVLVAATVFLTVVGPLPLCLLVLLTAGLLLVLPTLFLVLLSPGLLLLALGLSLLILICGLRLLLLFLLLLLLALGLLLLVLIGRLGLLLLLFLLLLLLTLSLLLLMLSLLLLSVLLLLLFRLGLLLLFRSLGLLLVLILLCLRGGDCSKKKDQNSRADETGAFHVCCLRCNIPCGPLLVAPGAAVFRFLSSWSMDISPIPFIRCRAIICPSLQRPAGRHLQPMPALPLWEGGEYARGFPP